MTVARKRALANAVASARMEGLEISEQEKRDCLRYLDGKIDTATLVREALKRQKSKERVPEVDECLYHRAAQGRLLSGNDSPGQ